MTITITLPGYLILRGRTYHFRRMVPIALRHSLGKREIKVSLQTSDVGLAAMRAREIFLETEKVFAMGDDKRRDKFLSYLAPVKTAYGPASAEELADYHRRQPNTFDKKGAAAKPAQPDSPLLSQVIAEFLTDKKRSGAWSENSAQKEGAKLTLVLDMLGDKPIADVTKKDAVAVKDLLLSLPPKAIQRGKPVAKYAGMTWQEIAAQKHEKTLSPKTWSHYQKILSSLFNWARQHDAIDLNPFEDLKIKGAKARERVPFTDAQAQAVLAALEHEPVWFAWIVVIAMYSGARLGEICQLYRDDIVENDGVWCFRIGDEKSDQRVKAEASRRYVPIHSKLLEMNFLSWVETKQDRLFDNLTQTKATDYNSEPSKRFAALKDKLGLKVENPDRYRLDFHSWRHTVATKLMDSGVPEQHVAALLGHAKGKTMSFSVYAHGVSVANLKEAVERISYA